MDFEFDYTTFYQMAAIGPDGVIVQHSVVAEDDLDEISVGTMPKGSYITCLPIPQIVH